MDKIDQKQLDEIINKHIQFNNGTQGGTRAVLKFIDLSGLNFRQADLSNADFSGSCLNDAKLNHGTFKSASFFSCDLARANLSFSDFSRCDFRGAQIIGADLTSANFEHADMRRGVMMNYGGEDDAKWGQSGETMFAGSTIRDTNLSNVMAQQTNFSSANLSGMILNNANLKDANFQNANLSHANLTGSNMVGVNMDGTIVKGINAAGVTGDNAKIREMVKKAGERKKIAAEGTTMAELVNQHAKWLETAGKEGEQMNLSEYDLTTEKELRKYPLTVVIATGGKFTALFLEGVKMESSILDKSDFQDCDGRNADFRGSSLKEALFNRADFSDSNFGALKVSRPDGSEILQSTNLSGAKLSFSKFDNTSFRNAILKDVDFTFASLKGCDFTDSDLTGAIFDNADLSDAKINKAL